MQIAGYIAVAGTEVIATLNGASTDCYGLTTTPEDAALEFLYWYGKRKL